jgi:type III secretion protein U
MATKTEAPTPRRLRRALAEGDAPVSAIATRTSVLIVALLLAPSASRAVAERFRGALRATLDGPGEAPAVSAGGVALDVLALAGPLLAAMAAAALVVGLVQTGGVVTLGSSTRRAEVGVFARVFSGASFVRALVAAATAVSVLVGAAVFLRAHGRDLVPTLGARDVALAGLGAFALRSGWIAGAVLAAGAAVDLVVERLLWLRRLRMTLPELKRERREAEGDPNVARERRRLHEALARGEDRTGR